jgi:hypothetical protein
LPIPHLDRATAARAEDLARVAEQDMSAQIARLYRYDLVARNCVTEVFDTIDGALGAQRATAEDAARARLGGHVDGRGELNFIPRLSLRSVDRTYRIGEHLTLPSYRKLRVAELEQSGERGAARIRESITLTSTVYRPSLEDGIFLFFTDGPVLPRPLLGGLNLLAASGAAAVGIAALPFDHGAILGAALRGALFSLPELAFVNIRKGSIGALPRGALPLGLGGDGARL